MRAIATSMQERAAAYLILGETHMCSSGLQSIIDAADAADAAAFHKRCVFDADAGDRQSTRVERSCWSDHRACAIQTSYASSID